MNPPDKADVVIAGGGPAGSAAAITLARAGRRVLLLERDAHPRFRIGESLLPYGNDLLRELGVWDDLVADGRFMEKRGAEFGTADGAHFQRFSFAQGLGPAHAFTFQVERSRFDALLFARAATAGATTREHAAVTSLAPDAHGVTVTYTHAGTPHTVRARHFLDATGRDAVSGRLLHLPKIATQPARRLATYAHFHGVTRNDGDAAGNITILRAPGGWFWLIPLDAEKTSVGYVRLLADLKENGLSPDADFDRALAAFPALRDRLATAHRVAPAHSTGDYSYRFRSFAPHPRILLTGDAAGFVDPIFSSGVLLALKSAHRAARLLLRHDERPLGPLTRARYTADVRRMMNLYRGIIRAFYDAPSFELFMHPEPPWDVRRAVLALVGGRTELPLPLRCRLHAFHLCRHLQRWLPLAPRIPSLTACPPPTQA